MIKRSLAGVWGFALDEEKKGIEEEFYLKEYDDTITLPNTVSNAKKGNPSTEAHIGYLTDPYEFNGYTWYKRRIDFEEIEDKEIFLILERTRVSHIWIDDKYLGSNNSLSTSHRYSITSYISDSSHRLTIMVDNTSYPVKGGHMTSPDTQTNWNGILGDIYIEECSKVYLSDIMIKSEFDDKFLEVEVTLNGADYSSIICQAYDETSSMDKITYDLIKGKNKFIYKVNKEIKPWDEHNTNLYTLSISLESDNKIESKYYTTFGFREFKALGRHFYINNNKTFLRGKHDGLVFPITGYAPTDIESWIEILKIAKDYGINHYRFHTCCPPKACFIAADIVGIYLEPELPFWGTVTGEGEEGHDEKALAYLIEEGYGILREFGNHPSFVMMSLGNELWGNKKVISKILSDYKVYDSRHLYTQGSNNFQFMPCILEEEDFYCGVRLSKDRLFRGSYAMCDAPQGHIQTQRPRADYNYDEMINPKEVNDNVISGGNISIQYGIGTKIVQADNTRELRANIPVVSHEIGQFAMYPDFTEIEKYTGVLKARNFEVFRERLKEKSMLDMAEKFFLASGKLAVDCYKLELETALKTTELAGFQILDLQDFPGQGTALVGILNAFMENKGLVTKERWQQFCSDGVIMAELAKFVFTSNEELKFAIKLALFRKTPIVNPTVELIVLKEQNIIKSDKFQIQGEFNNDFYQLNNFKIIIPETLYPEKLDIIIRIIGTDIENNYEIWTYPKKRPNDIKDNVIITSDKSKISKYLDDDKSVLYYPNELDDSNSIEGTYCTDFWCYPMFRSISESMNKPEPIGTLGLLIDNEHPIFKYFPTKYYTTPQWYDMVSNSRAVVLDGKDIEPIVWTVDNFERNHKLGNIFEVDVKKGRLMVSTFDASKLNDNEIARWLEYSILKYLSN